VCRVSGFGLRVSGVYSVYPSQRRRGAGASARSCAAAGRRPPVVLAAWVPPSAQPCPRPRLRPRSSGQARPPGRAARRCCGPGSLPDRCRIAGWFAPPSAAPVVFPAHLVTLYVGQVTLLLLALDTSVSIPLLFRAGACVLLVLWSGGLAAHLGLGGADAELLHALHLSCHL